MVSTLQGCKLTFHWVALGMLPSSQTVQCPGGCPLSFTQQQILCGSHKGFYTTAVNGVVPGKRSQGRVGCLPPSPRCYGSPAGGDIGVQVSGDLCSVQEG